jgi:hypothetical protein
MYLVTAGNTSVRAAASRRPLELAIVPWTRSAPNTVVNANGTSTIARTFQRTGQLLGDQAGGRFAGSSPVAEAEGNSGGTASTGWAGRVNMVTWLRPRDRPLRFRWALTQTRDS